MLVRIVKLTIREENIPSFEKIFEDTSDTIRNTSGCRLLELYRDRKDRRIFFTYSYWNSEAELEAYRDSEFFRKVWGKTKQLFALKPEAWSVDKMVVLN